MRYLQGWIKRRVVQTKRYWVVNMDAVPVACCEDQHHESTKVVCDAEVELSMLEVEEETRIRKDPSTVIGEDLDTNTSKGSTSCFPASANHSQVLGPRNPLDLFWPARRSSCLTRAVRPVEGLECHQYNVDNILREW